MINDKTTRNYPLPHPENIAKQDVVRIREAFIGVDADMNEIEAIIIRLDKAKKLREFEDFIELWSGK